MVLILIDRLSEALNQRHYPGLGREEAIAGERRADPLGREAGRRPLSCG
ncbi:MAG: hypothetical protein OXM87_01850 [Truepera sp.]|nr:hypothetical protein [Truepera sp.]